MADHGREVPAAVATLVQREGDLHRAYGDLAVAAVVRDRRQPALLLAQPYHDTMIVQKLLAGHQAADKTFKAHLDGYNALPYLTGREPSSPRKGSPNMSIPGPPTSRDRGVTR